MNRRTILQSIVAVLLACLPADAGGRYLRSCGVRCYAPSVSYVQPTYQPQQVQHKFDPTITINNVIGQQPLLGDTAFSSYPQQYPPMNLQALKEYELKRTAETAQALSATIQTLANSRNGTDALLLQVARDRGDVERLRAQTELIRAAQRKEDVVQHQTSGGSYIQTEVKIDGVTKSQGQKYGAGQDKVPDALEVIQHRCANCHTANEPKGGISYEAIERLTPVQWATVLHVTAVKRTMPKDQELLPAELSALLGKMADPAVAAEFASLMSGE